MLHVMHYRAFASSVCDLYTHVCVTHHGRGSLLHAAKDEGLAVLPDLVLPITQPVHQSWQHYRDRKRERVGGWVVSKSQYMKTTVDYAPMSHTRQIRSHDTESPQDLNANDKDCPQVEHF